MYIEFRIQDNVPRMVIARAHASIGTNLAEWAEKYNIQYRQKIHKYTLRVTFDKDEFYTLFALTWVSPEWTTYRLVTDLNNKI